MEPAILPVKNILTFDLEEWYHILDIPDCPGISSEETLSIHTVKSLTEFLDMLGSFKITCTFFVLGKIARHSPKTILRIRNAGHEIASHGFNHELITSISPIRFREDIRLAKDVLEQITGEQIYGYRGPGFSITPHNLWALDEIAEAGYVYDATVYPGKHGHGGIPGLPVRPLVLKTPKGATLEEYPVTVADLVFFKTAFAGGGYFRLFPFWLVSILYRKMNEKNVPVNSYFHARDFDPDVPRVPMPLHRRFKCYVNLKSTHEKLQKVLQNYPGCSIRDWRKGKNALPVLQLYSTAS